MSRGYKWGTDSAGIQPLWANTPDMAAVFSRRQIGRTYPGREGKS
jgi:hypothetical protein